MPMTNRNDQELLHVYQSCVDETATIEQAREAFCGKYDSEADWAEQYLNDTGDLLRVPAHLRDYIDFEAYGRDARLGGDMYFTRYEGDLWCFYANV